LYAGMITENKNVFWGAEFLMDVPCCRATQRRLGPFNVG